jgi:hypothetical protein
VGNNREEKCEVIIIIKWREEGVVVVDSIMFRWLNQEFLNIFPIINNMDKEIIMSNWFWFGHWALGIILLGS